MTTHVAEIRSLARVDEAMRIVHEAEEIERIQIRRAARLLTPRLSFTRRAMATGSTVRMSPVPEKPPELLMWRYYEGFRYSDEPVAKLLRRDASGAVYGVADTRAGRAFRAMLEDIGEPAVQIPAPGARTAEVNFGE